NGSYDRLLRFYIMWRDPFIHAYSPVLFTNLRFRRYVYSDNCIHIMVYLIGTFVYPNDRIGTFISILRRSTLISLLLCNSSAIFFFLTYPNNLSSSPYLTLISYFIF